MPAEPHTLPDPLPILDLLNAFRKTQVMFTAVELGLFEELSSTPKMPGELAIKLSLNQDALERLLGALVMLGLLERTSTGEFRNSAITNTYLLSSSPNRMLGYINYSNAILWKMWDDLPSAICEGTHRWKATFGSDGPIFTNFFRNEKDKREFVFGMHGYGLISSPHVVSAMDLSRFKTFVDLGGATGHLAIAACEKYKAMQGIVFDLPVVVSLTQEVVSASPVADRIEIVPGDFFTDALPPGDLFALGRILHDWSEEKIFKLLQRIFEALPEGGGVLIAEKVLNDDKAGPEWAVLQSLNILVCTEGKERTFGEYESILKKVGFREVHLQRTTSPLDVVLGVK